MRSFWIAIGVLAVIVAVLLWRGRTSDVDAGRPDKDPAQVSQPSASPQQLNEGGERGEEAAGRLADEASLGSGAPAGGAATSGLADGSSSRSGTEPTSTARVDDPSDHARKALADELMESADQAGGEDIADALDDDSLALPGNHEEDEPAPAPAPAASGAPASIDGKYIIAGEGTAAAPYEITWDLLILASQTYQPRQGKTDIPAQVAAVNGRRIKIAGYFAVPIASTDPKEVLFMLNMWDGCCIGVPPSPYDAIEVRLKEPLDGGKQFVNYATLTGTLTVDPFVQNGWLLGMYVMSDGELEIDL